MPNHFASNLLRTRRISPDKPFKSGIVHRANVKKANEIRCNLCKLTHAGKWVEERTTLRMNRVEATLIQSECEWRDYLDKCSRNPAKCQCIQNELELFKWLYYKVVRKSGWLPWVELKRDVFIFKFGIIAKWRGQRSMWHRMACGCTNPFFKSNKHVILMRFTCVFITFSLYILILIF